MVATVGMLQKPDVVQYVGQNAYRFGLDPAAVLAVANHEGLNTTPGSTWVLPNEAGFNFGPPSWYSGGAGSNIIAQQGNQAAYWAWTPAGLDYWLQTVAASGASGQTGLNAIDTIVRRFERPRADLIGNATTGEIGNAWRDYQAFQQQIQVGGNTIVPVPNPIPGQTFPTPFPTPNDPQQTPSQTQGKAAPKFSMHILDLPTGPVNLTLPWDFSGILLFLAAIFAIIIGALLWDKSRNVIVKGGEAAAIAA